MCPERATDVDHIDGNSRNNSPSNLRALCHKCHSRRTAREQSFHKQRGGFVAKRKVNKKTTKKTAAKAAPKPPEAEERASFLPDETPEKKEELKFDVKVEAKELETAQGISLTVGRGEDRRLVVALTIPPLVTHVEPEMWPLPGTAPEHIAGKIAAALERAAHSVASDAAVQYARRLNEEAKSKERYAGRA
jgi:hypothetical protein